MKREQARASRQNEAARQRLWQYLLSGVAAAVTLAAVNAKAESPVLEKNEAPATLTKAIVLPDFTQLVKHVKPAVVSVRVREYPTPQVMSDEYSTNPYKGGVFPAPVAGEWTKVGQGSGFFISADGYIVTNNHVVDNALEVQVVTDNGQTLAAKVAGSDRDTDLALIKVDSGQNFPFVALAKERPQIGEWVIAMGNPFGLGGTVTAGIISAEGRDIGAGPYDDYLQIDAPINRGNSGGPTFNLKGEVIGVNTAIISPSGGFVGIAFDIPASTVETVVPQLQKYGYVNRGWLGVQILPLGEGVFVADAEPESPAAHAGLKTGDVITAINGESVKSARWLARRIAAMVPGTEVTLMIVRGSAPDKLTLRLGQTQNKIAKRESPGRPASN
ncbi:MAG: S1C family serine protease [Rhodomicrobium sp.]